MREPKVVVNSRKAKWDTGDVLAVEAMRPLGGGFTPWTSFSLRPAALLTVLNEIDFREPRVVVELGSGSSTLYIARLLARHQDCRARLVTIESNDEWARYISALVEREELGRVVDLVQSPLVDWSDGNFDPEEVEPAFFLPDRWYDAAPVLTAIGADEIGLLLVDGPPGGRTLSRYPAIPVLRDRLAADAVVMLDDANRPAEMEIVRRWSQLLAIDFTIYQRMSLAVGRLAGGYTLLG